MSTAREQGEIWGARPDDWQRFNEPAWEHCFAVVLDRLGVGAGTRYLDLGCGSGGALAMARARGAHVAGIDASAGLLGMARARLPGADLRQGDVMDLPYPDAGFDVVSMMNVLQFCPDAPRTLAEAARVCRPGGQVAVLLWGSRADNALLSDVLPPVFALLPPNSAPPTKELDLVPLLAEAGLVGVDLSEFASTLEFPDIEAAMRANLAAMTRAIRHAGEPAVREALAAGLERHRDSAGRIRLASRFRIAIGQRA